jgi:hypothetical protein
MFPHEQKRLKPLLALLECHYSHFFAVSWTHKIAVRGPLHAQISQGKGRAFRQIGRIYVQKIEIGRISLQ